MVVVVGVTVGESVVELVMFVVGDHVKVAPGLTELKVIDQSSIIPWSPAKLSETTRFQVPLTLHAFKVVKACSGVKLPLNGAVPVNIDVPVGVKQVFV